MEKFRIRPVCGGMPVAIELCGDHRAPGFPDVARILAATLASTRQAPSVPAAEAMIASDRYVGASSYDAGRYEIDDDIWACCIIVPDGNANVVADIERALSRSGLFVRDILPAPC